MRTSLLHPAGRRTPLGARARRTLVTLLLCALCAQSALGDERDAQQAAQEAQARQKLEQVRAEIHRISDEQKAAAARKNDATAALREQELKVAAAAKDVRSAEQKLAAQQGKLEQSLAERAALDAKLATQREALAALLRSAYALGRGEELKLLLAQERTDTIGRMLAYYGYFERARVAEIETLLNDLEALAKVQRIIEAETAELKNTRDAHAAEAQRLQAERGERARVLDELDAALKDRQARLAALGKDEKSLLELLEKLRDVFADIPQQISGAEPFARLRGRLAWPLHGKIMNLSSAGEEGERESHGVLIAAAGGSDVHAVSHGRVVFADWLRGFGLLLIVDHGDGYLSLYGYNESLLKEVGDWVDAGEAVATSGVSGGRKTPGVYFELRLQGKALDARAWLKPSSH